jgi:hypothetical protein
MKKLLWFTTALMFVAAPGANAQWKFIKIWPDNAATKNWPSGVNNGIAVDRDSKVWLQTYSGNCDSIGPTYVKTGSIYVFNKDGTPASFSPIKILTGIDQNRRAVVDTLNGNGYGLTVDPSTGDILSVKGDNRLWRIDSKTGKGIARIQNPIPSYSSSICTPAIDNLGNLFVAPVNPGPAMVILNPDFSATGIVMSTTVAACRCIAVSSDGNDVYFPALGSPRTTVYHSDYGSLGPYVPKDTILLGIAVESAVWAPKTGYLWVSSGNVFSGLPPAPLQGYRWYAYNTSTRKIVDTIAWQGDLSFDPRPRGIAFSPGGDTAYVGVFNYSPSVQMFVRGGAVSVEQGQNEIPSRYSILQNYPIPFNPSTMISYDLPKESHVTVVVYNTLGQLVTTLVDEKKNAGHYQIQWDASTMPSGVYFYRIQAGEFIGTKKMILLR